MTINEYQPKPLPALYVDLTGSLKNWEKITDYMRLAVGQRYLSLLEKRTVNSPRPSAQVRDQFYKELGVTLTSVDEWNEMIEAFEEGRQKFQDRFWGDFTPQFAMGLFQVVAVTNQVANPLFQGTEQFAVVLCGVDFFGEPVDKTERIIANSRRRKSITPKRRGPITAAYPVLRLTPSKRRLAGSIAGIRSFVHARQPSGLRTLLA